MTIRIALTGFGKSARDQHVPSIAGFPHCELVAGTSRSGETADGVTCFADLGALLAAMPGQSDAAATCAPPDVHHAIAADALDAGLAVLLEKPPTATLGEIEDLVQRAAACGQPLHASWHSQHAPTVRAAAALLRGTVVRRLRITWREDVRKWHSGQEWIWEPGGFGVFDPGINALSIATAILPERLIVRAADLQLPGNRQTPIAADLTFAGEDFSAAFDWRHQGDEERTIEIETTTNRHIKLGDSGASLFVDGIAHPVEPRAEYPSIYARFAELVAAGQSDVDVEPLRIVADALLLARRTMVEPFVWTAGE
ncbi:galactose 1-dehydrogenase [Polymorphobacter multimanifer]|uniref:Gfo/Idh/MocA family protein n=1 Tax=Polymorphobacter multimanifer TaxID=1070431 RepID=UPI0016677A13|nr:Gfo/Idh/MocA family oxidoreductase [Polymorphobacter multimanifer]GGI76917.1 galactose 1-dehydrogenase [Polymorphobacter multimanifer]